MLSAEAVSPFSCPICKAYFYLVSRNILQWDPEPGDHQNGIFLTFLSCFLPGELTTRNRTARAVSGGARTIAGPPSLDQIHLPPLAVTLFWARGLWKASGSTLKKPLAFPEPFKPPMSPGNFRSCLIGYDIRGQLLCIPMVSGTQSVLTKYLLCKWIALRQ